MQQDRHGSWRRWLRFFMVMIAVTVMVPLSSKKGRANAQHRAYMTGAAWKNFLSKKPGVFEHWNSTIQARVDGLAAIAEAEGTDDSPPFLVAMVGDSTMMQQHGVVCAYLAERVDSRFSSKEHNDACCVDTRPRVGRDKAKSSMPFEAGTEKTPGGELGWRIERGGDGGGDGDGPMGEGGREGGRGLCFRHVYQRFSTPPTREEIGEADAVYFCSGLHFLHMCRKGVLPEKERVTGWLHYEQDLEASVRVYRERAQKKLRLVFMTSHSIEDSKYTGGFRDVLEGYAADDPETISYCQDKVVAAAKGAQGQGDYTVDTYCRMALLARSGSDVLNQRARPVMARVGVPLVEGDLIVRDQAWATPFMDGRHYHWLVPLEVFVFLGVLTNPHQEWSPPPEP